MKKKFLYFVSVLTFEFFIFCLYSCKKQSDSSTKNNSTTVKVFSDENEISSTADFPTADFSSNADSSSTAAFSSNAGFETSAANTLNNSFEENQNLHYKNLATQYAQKMTLEQKISQMFMENLEGSKEFRTFETFGQINGTDDNTPLVAGGYIFFSYNIADTPSLMKDFIKSIRSFCSQNNLIQPYLAVDVEGGDVNRLRKLTSKLPSNQTVAKEYSVGQAFELYTNQAKQMKELGFDMNLAPVAETLTSDNADFILERSFGDAYDVLNYGSACIKAYEKQGIATVLKHFPGNTNADPHSLLPEINLSSEELEKNLAPFKRLIKKSPTAVLMSHARASAVDSENPSCLSKKWVTGILREELGYEGLVISDDIFMAALEKNGYPSDKAVVMAVLAGVDCIMTSEKRFARHAAVLYQKAMEDSDFYDLICAASERVIFYKLKSGILEGVE